MSKLICRFCQSSFLAAPNSRYCCLFCAFWDHVAPPNENGCCLWTGNHNGTYGMISFHGRNYYATKLCLRLHGVTLIKGLDTMHWCNVPLCVSLDHLQQGTERENVQYAIMCHGGFWGRAISAHPPRHSRVALRS